MSNRERVPISLPAISAEPAIRGAAARGFEAAVLLVEAVLVAAAGAGVLAAWHLLGWAVVLPGPIALAASYGMLVVACGAAARPPRRARQQAALRVLGAVFLVGTLVTGHFAHSAAPMAAWLALAAAAVAGWRWAAMRLSQSIAVLAPPLRQMAFLGNSEGALRLLGQIEADPHARLRPIGFFDDRSERIGPLHGRLDHLGSIAELVSYIHDHELQDVFVALPWSAGERISELIERLRFLPLNVRLIPDRPVPALRARNAHQMEGVVMPTLMLPPFSPAGAAVKRAFDLLGAAALLILLSPLFVLVALAIRIDSAGPVFFLQRRSGQFGRAFSIWKFRSLHVARQDQSAEALVGRGDTRVTRVGHYLRKYSIDELPQIINVLLGEMSLIGPRPHAPRAKADGRIYAEVMPDYMLRYRVKPGMTGWAQVNGWRGNTDTEEKLRKRVEFDFDYIKHWSFMRDLRILLKTIPSTLFPPVDNV